MRKYTGKDKTTGNQILENQILGNQILENQITGKRYLFYLALLVCFCFGELLRGTLDVPCEVHAEEVKISEDGYSAILYDRNSGLPTSEANAIVQTKNGFIWIGSYSGLIRYDGNNFVRYNPEMGIASVMSLYVDSRDRLWIGTNDSGAALYEDGEFCFYRKEDGLGSLSVRSISEDGEGNIILATTKGLAYVAPDGRLHPLEDVHIGDAYIRNIVRDAEGVIYGVTANGAFFVLDRLVVTYFFDEKQFGVEVSCIYPISREKGKVCLGTWDSRIIVKDITGGEKEDQSYSVAPLTNINKILPEGDRLWVCADNGIGFLDANGSYRTLDNIPMNNSVDGMMKDYEGNLWFVSSRQGVMEITSSPFIDISKRAGLGSMVVNSTCLYQDRLYIGTDRGLVILDKELNRLENSLTESLSGIRIRCIKADSVGKLWLCCYNDKGLVCYDGNSFVTYNTGNGLVSNWVRAMTELSDGTIAVAASGGLSLIRDGEVVRSYGKEDGLENTEILTVCDGEDGKFYLGSDGDGIYIVDGEKVSHLGMSDGLQSEIILRIKEDPELKLYWIITSNSISYMKNGMIGTVTNFPYSNNFDLYFNKTGEMWVLSSNGIYVVDGKRLLTGEKLEYTFYDFQCGLPYVATANSRSCISEDGTMYISGTAGVSSINIDSQNEGNQNIRLCVPFIEIDDRTVEVKEGETVVIPANCKRLTIYGYALTYTLHNPHLSYRLDGFDEEALVTTGNEMDPVSYTNLDGGEYTFYLSVVDSRSGVEQSTVAVKFRKERAVYEQLWFWLVLGAAVIAVVVLLVTVVIHRKTAFLMKKQEESQTFINQMTAAFAKSIDLKDKYTNGHSSRVAQYSKMLAKKLGYEEEEVARIHNIALLHDVGKIAVPDEILNKPGKLTDEEYKIIKQHAANGYDILKEIEVVPDLALGAGFHHERMDGKGYPSGRMGQEIPMVAQIIAVADTFDAMNSTRPYRKQMKMEDIEEELKRVAGTQLNADIVKVMVSLIDEGMFA